MQDLMKGKRGLIMGVANDHSIAWGIARTLAAQGAELAFTYQGEALGKRVKPLAEQVGASLVLPCDVEDIGSVDAVRSGAFDVVVANISEIVIGELKPELERVAPRRILSGFQDYRGEWTCVVE